MLLDPIVGFWCLGLLISSKKKGRADYLIRSGVFRSAARGGSKSRLVYVARSGRAKAGLARCDSPISWWMVDVCRSHRRTVSLALWWYPRSWRGGRLVRGSCVNLGL